MHFGTVAVAWPFTAGAQQLKKMHRIGVLWHGADAEQEAIYLAALRQGLHDVGYVEGQNLTLEMRFPAEQYQRFFVLAEELARQRVDLLVCATAIAAVACHRATTTIPIVGVNVADPVGRKLVASLGRPGGNLTGLSNIAVELTGKRIELAKEMIQDLSRVALLVNTADEIGSRAYIAAADDAGARIGVAVVPVGVRDANDLEGAISKISTGNFQATVVTTTVYFTCNENASPIWLWKSDCRSLRLLASSGKPACLQPMDRTCLPCIDAQARTSTGSSKEQTPPICLLSNPRNLSFLSTCRLLRRLV